MELSWEVYTISGIVLRAQNLNPLGAIGARRARVHPERNGRMVWSDGDTILRKLGSNWDAKDDRGGDPSCVEQCYLQLRGGNC